MADTFARAARAGRADDEFSSKAVGAFSPFTGRPAEMRTYLLLRELEGQEECCRATALFRGRNIS